MTVSIGCTGHRHGEALERFLHRLDEALHAAEDAGRNRVVEAADTPVERPADN